MKVRITKIPDKKQESLNARKWKHGDGGFMNMYDGESEKTGWLSRFLNTPTMVPNMTGIATAAATGLRDIPLMNSTVGDELKVAGAALASPVANLIMSKLAVPLVGSALLDEAFRKYTPYQGWGDALVTGTGLGEVMDYALLPEKQQDIIRMGADFTNPAFFAPYEGISKAVAGLPERAAGYLKDIRSAMKGRPTIQPTFLHEPAQAFAVDVNQEQAKAIAEELGLDTSRIGDEELFARVRTPRRGRMHQAINVETGEVEYLPERVVFGSEPSVSTEAPTIDVNLRAGTITPHEPASLSERSYEDLGRMLYRNSEGFSEDEIRQAMRDRAWRDLGFPNSRHDVADLSLDDLVRLTEGYGSPNRPTEALNHLNNGLFSHDIGYVDTYNLRESARAELRNRMNNYDVPSSYASLEDAARDFDLFGRVRNHRQQDNVFRSATPDLRIAIGRQEDIPSEFTPNIGRLVSEMYDRGIINEQNRYFADALRRDVGDLSKESIPDLLDKYARFTGRPTYIEDYSGSAVRKLVDRFGRRLSDQEMLDLQSKFGHPITDRFYDYRDLLGKINNMDALPAAEQDEMRRIINSAYGYRPRNSPTTASQKYMSGLVENELQSRLPENYTGNRNIATLFDPFDNDYVDLAKAMRDAGATRLPADVDHLAWFQVQNAADDRFGSAMNEAERAYRTAQGTQLAGLQTELLTRALPRQTAIVEHNTSPNSYKVMTKGSLRAPEGFGYGPGQVTLEPVNVADWTAKNGNTAQLRKVRFGDDGKMVFGQATDGVEPYMFTRDEAKKLLDDLENISMDGIESYIRNNPESRELIDKTIRLSQALNRADIKDVSNALKLVNKKRVSLGKEPIALPEESKVPLTSDNPDFYEHSNLISITSDARRVLRNMLSSDGYAAQMQRTPIITLRHKYGGMLDRIDKVYGNDTEKILQAIQNARAKQK